VSAAGGVARSAGIPLIGFSNNSGAAQPGVYLLNVLPESEAKRSLRYAQSLGKRAFAGIFPNSDYGRIQQSAFTPATSELGIRVVGIYSFGSETEARDLVAQMAPTLLAGQVDALFLPDRATAPSFGVLFEEAKVASGAIQIIGSADWNGDLQISSTPYLTGALYPAVDDQGFQALLPLYSQRFGGTPHPFVTIAYTAVILANVSSLSMGTPRYDRSLLTAPAGFNGRDGVFRFLSDGRSEYALVIKKITMGGAQLVDGAKL
jgi:branched-chain amino acid transport system substrate-binding protein